MTKLLSTIFMRAYLTLATAFWAFATGFAAAIDDHTATIFADGFGWRPLTLMVLLGIVIACAWLALETSAHQYEVDDAE